MDRLKIIFNGNPNTGSENIIRAAMAVTIPLLTGLGGAAYQSVTSP